MRRDTINYLVVGSFVLVLFALLMFMLYQITGRSGPADEYYVTYPNVEGIKYGTPVLYEGYQIGQVGLVEPVRDGAGTHFRLTLEVTKGWGIPDDSIAEVVKSGLLSAVAIDIKEGESGAALQPGDAIEGQAAADIFSAVNDVAADIRSLSRDSIRPLLDNLNTQVTEVSADLHSLLRESAQPLLDGEVRELVVKLNGTADRLDQILSAENKEKVDSILTNLDTASADTSKLMQELEQTRTTLDTLLADVNEVIQSNDEDVRDMVKDLRKSLDTVSRHIDAVAHHMEGSSRNMNEFTRLIRENPGLLLRGSPQQEDGAAQ